MNSMHVYVNREFVECNKYMCTNQLNDIPSMYRIFTVYVDLRLMRFPVNACISYIPISLEYAARRKKHV